MSRSLRATRIERLIKAVAVRRQFHPLDRFQVDEVIGLLETLERKLGGLPPSIGLRRDVGQLIRGITEERRHVGGKLFAGDAIDRAVAVDAPWPRGQQKQADDNQGQ